MLSCLSRNWLYVFLITLFANFYFSIASSSFAAFSRYTVIAGFLVVSYDLWTRKRFVLWSQVANNRLFVLVCLFFVYLICVSFFNYDFKGVRRSGFVFVFLLFSFFSLKNYNVNFRKVYLFVPCFSLVLALAYFYSYYHNFGLSFDYRVTKLFKTVFPVFKNYTNTVTAGVHIAILIPFCLRGWFFSESKVYKYLSLLAFFCISAVLFITFSRVAWLCAFVIFIIFICFSLKERRYKDVLIVVMPFVLFCVFYIMNFIGVDLQRGLTGRGCIWQNLLSHITTYKDFVFGKGLYSSGHDFKSCSGASFNMAHSIYLDILYKAGLIGCAILCTVVISVYYKFFCSISFVNDELLVWYSIFIAVSIAMAVDFYSLIYPPNLMWLWFWCPLIFIIAKKTSGNTEHLTQGLVE